MTADRWRDLERLYHEARTREPAARPAFLQQACGDDEELRAEVESLLSHREQASEFLELPAAVAAGPDALLPVPTADATSSTVSRAGAQRLPPWWMVTFAVVLLVGAGGLCWLLLTGPEPTGLLLDTIGAADDTWIRRAIVIAPGSPAEHAGFEVNDLVNRADLARFLAAQQPGVAHRFTVLRDGRATPLVLTLGARDARYWTGRAGRHRLALMVSATLYLVLALLLAFKRSQDAAARWGALLIAQMGVLVLQLGVAVTYRLIPEAAQALRAMPVPISVCVLAALAVALTVPLGAFGFCTAFPQPIPISRRAWWATGLSASTTLLLDVVNEWLPVYGTAIPLRGPVLAATGVPMVLGLIYLAWALRLLRQSYRQLDSQAERRRVRIVSLGFAASACAFALLIVAFFPGAGTPGSGVAWYAVGWGRALSLVLFAVTPVCITYAILRHQVFDLRFIVRLGVRYAFARGIILSIVPIAGLVLVADVLIHRTETVGNVLRQRGLPYLALVAGALILHLGRTRLLDALDRRFYREHYDAYRLLNAVVDDVRHAREFAGAARHVIERIGLALHPEFTAVMVRKTGDLAFRPVAGTRSPLATLPADSQIIASIRETGRPLETPRRPARSETHARDDRLELLRRTRVELLFPVSLGTGGAEAVLLLGPRRSEEPYSREDRELLQALAGSLGLVLERPAGVTTPPGFGECSTCGACFDTGAAGCAGHETTLVKSPYSRVVAGRYRLDRRIGRGGMGTVYESWDARLERHVAVKVIRPDLMETPDATRRFRREARAVARLSHPNVVALYDFGVADDDRAYIVMERLRGRSLREELQEHGAIERARTLRILRGIGAAVALAHERGIVHRDLKPENIFLTCDEGNEAEIAKILDFGLAKSLFPDASATATQTVSGTIMGTLAYMSPEQQRGGVPSAAWDTWALAVVAFEMLTGTHPFGATSIPGAAPVGAGATLDSARLSSFGVVTAFFERALSPDPARRPSSVAQFLEGIEGLRACDAGEVRP